jgi:uncharacterized membrane protein YsdA (DUF1294 family)/cold shock CspA family protein
MRYQGKVTNWKDDQGFGFIIPNGGGKQVFVHIKSFSNKRRRPVDQEIVTYELKSDAQGRSHAQNVSFIDERMVSAHPSRANSPLVIAIVFLLFVIGTVLSDKLHVAVLELYLATSILAFCAYALDKSAAKNDRWRTQESTLHFFGLIGGWPGALAAQRLFHHKSKKQSFQIVFWITVVSNLYFFCWLLTPSGIKVLHSILGQA